MCVKMPLSMCGLILQKKRTAKPTKHSARPTATYADAVATALVRLFIEDGREANVSALINACADRIAEAVAERLLEALPAGMVAARAVADSEPQNGAQNETQHSSGRSTGDTSDYIPDEEIPWDFLNP